MQLEVVGEIRVTSDRFLLGWLSGNHTPFPGVCVLIAYYCICSRVPDTQLPLENRLVLCDKLFIK